MTKTFRNFHMLLVPIRGEGAARVWRCEYCKEEGGIVDLQKSQCSHKYPTCEHCGGSEDTNECRPDCPGIAKILSDPSLYIAGFSPEPDG